VIADWTVPFVLQTQFGNLPINQPLGTSDTRRFQLTPSKCSAVLPVRATDDDVPQGDGKISHRRWRSGYQAHLAVEPFQEYDSDSGDGVPACDVILVEMLDLLGLHLNELVRTGQVGGAGARLSWTPSGFPDRMFDRLQLLAVSAPSSVEGDLGGTQVEFDVDSAFPYYIEATETDTISEDGATETITNVGNTDSFAVFEVYGPYTGFTLVNHSVQDLDGVDLQIVYDSTLPGGEAVGGGDWIEFEFFRETAYANSAPRQRKGSVDWRVSDFFPLVPGDNLVEINFLGGGGGTSTYALCKSNGAWA
jgi:hypothetical protein